MATKVEYCARELSSWGAATFGVVKKRIKAKEEELERWQSRAPDGRMLGRCRKIVGELDELNRLHETYWHARARVNELKDGDKNTSYFHHKASQRKRRNLILKLQDDNGEWKTSEEDIGKRITDYISAIFSSSGPSNMEAALEGLRPR